jgi:hypothetical protein
MLHIQVSYSNIQISNNSDVSFLGLKTDNLLTWKDHIDAFVVKLNRSCFAIQSVKSILYLETLKMVYYSYVHSILNYEIIFWGKSLHIIRVFRIQKRIIRIIMNSAKRVSCHSLFRELGILPLQAEYILSISLFIITNRELFKFNSQVHKFNTRSTHGLYYHQTNLTQFQKGISYMGVKIFNHLPPEIKSMSNDTKIFKLKLTTFLLQNSFYAIEEFFWAETWLVIRFNNRFYNQTMYNDDRCNILYVAYLDAYVFHIWYISDRYWGRDVQSNYIIWVIILL